MYWLLEHNTLHELGAFARTVRMPDAAQGLFGDPDILHIAGDEATITITGILVSRPSPLVRLFGAGHTTYREIIDALELANGNPDIKRITLVIDSPGGQVAGLFDVLDALHATMRPITVRAGMALSAAYAIAAAGGRIEARGRASSFGSVGIAASFLFFSSETVIDVVNTDSPDKRPDLRTEAGKAVIRKELDAIFDLFVSAIARGRSKAKRSSVLASTVRTAYGKGATVLAGDALQTGMIDSVLGSAPAASTSATGDLGDQVVAQLVQQGFFQPRRQIPSSLSPSERAARLVAHLEAKGKLKPEPASSSAHEDEGDLGDRVVASMVRQGLIRPRSTSNLSASERADRLAARLEAKGQLKPAAE